MRRLAGTLAAALLAAASPRAFGGGEEDFNRPFYREAFSALRRLDSTREHAAFVLKHKVDLVIAAPEDGIRADQMGVYDGDKNTMYVNEGMLEAGADELRGRGVSEEDIPRVLAWKFVPTLAHEIRHAMLSAKLKARFGIEWHYSTLEDEMVAFVDTVRVLEEAIRAKPEYWAEGMLLSSDETNGNLLQEWKKEPAALKELVAPYYPGVPSLLSASHDDIVGLFLARERRCRERLSRGEPGAKAALDRNQRNLAWLSKPANFERLRDFYTREIQALIRVTP